MKDVVIASACRTPIAKFQGGLSSFRAPELGAVAIKEALRRARVAPDQVEEVIFGNVLQAGLGQNPARQAARAAGIPDSVGSFTVNKVCGSGLKSVMLAAQAIRAGDSRLVVAGGMESMSNAPHYLYGMRGGIKAGNSQLVDGMIHDGLWDSFSNTHMGNLAEYTARKAGVDRRLPRRCLAHAALQHVSHDHFFDRARLDRGAPHGLADHQRAQLRGRERRQAAQVLADWRTDGGENDRRRVFSGHWFSIADCGLWIAESKREPRIRNPKSTIRNSN